jgi:hypothetical protein
MAATPSPDQLVRGLIAGTTDPLLDAAETSTDPAVLVAAALAAPGRPELLARAAAAATSARDRQLVAIAAAHLHGDDDRTLLLARDHLADHPDAVLVAHIAALTCSNPNGQGAPS